VATDAGIAYGPRMLSTRLAVSSLVLAASAAVASAETVEETPEENPIAAREPANDHSFTPALTHARGPARGAVTSTLTIDRARDLTTLDVNGEFQVWGPFRLVVRVDNVTGSNSGNARPGIGGAAQLLDERKHGVAGSLYFQYKAEGFTEGEGELEGLVALGKQLGPVHGTLNLAYGQDPEAVERDGEVALGLHLEPVRGLFTGVVGRFRDALGSNGDKGTGVLRDVLGAVSATYVIDRFAVTALAGVGGVKLLGSDSMKAGAQAAFTVGAVF
jgi:hypothetical protein